MTVLVIIKEDDWLTIQLVSKSRGLLILRFILIYDKVRDRSRARLFVLHLDCVGRKYYA